jgi:hypothetical protein
LGEGVANPADARSSSLLGGAGESVIELTGQAHAQQWRFPRAWQGGPSAAANCRDGFLGGGLDISIIDDSAADSRFLVRDRAGQFTDAFDAVLASAGLQAMKSRPGVLGERFGERFVLTARTEVTDWMLIFGERHLRSVLADYETHYNGRRPHRGRQLHPPRPDHPVADLKRQRVKRQAVLGGFISEYERAG